MVFGCLIVDFQSKYILTLLLTLLLVLRERKAIFWQNIEYWVPAIGLWKGVEKKEEGPLLEGLKELPGKRP